MQSCHCSGSSRESSVFVILNYDRGLADRTGLPAASRVALVLAPLVLLPLHFALFRLSFGAPTVRECLAEYATTPTSLCSAIAYSES